MLQRMALMAATNISSFDPDADAYITAVQNADGQTLETATATAINAFVVGCKADGIWTAIKACCILAGARTLAGALVPLVGTAPTNNNFVSADYNRKTGLKGNGSNKSLNSNRNNNADPQNNFHAAVYSTDVGTLLNIAWFGAGPGTNETGATNFGPATQTTVFTRCRFGSTPYYTNASPLGFFGIRRNNSSNYDIRVSSVTSTPGPASSEAPTNANLFIFSATNTSYPADCRFAFYSIGESLNIALLDARVTTLINALAAAIP